MKYVIVTGSGAHLTVHGPFDKRDLAMNWATEAFGEWDQSDIDWTLQPLHSVNWTFGEG